MNQLGILSHVWNVFSFPYNKTIRWTDEESWHLESWLKFATRRPYNAIRSKYEESWHVESFFEICPPWTQPSKKYIYIYILAPTKHYIQHRSAWTSHLEPCLTCPFPTFAYVEYMNKVEMTRHLYILNSSPSPEKQYLEQTKQWASWVSFEIYNSVTLQCNTLNMWS